jgi:hypothetical protein
LDEKLKEREQEQKLKKVKKDLNSLTQKMKRA